MRLPYFFNSVLKKVVPVLTFLLILSPLSTWGSPLRDTRYPNAAATVSFTDSAGRTVAVPAKITRIAPSGSLAQMFLLAIAPDMLCAISDNYSAQQTEFIPDYVESLPVVGQFYGAANLNPEEIARIAPDIVIDIGEPKATIVKDMDAISESIAIPAVHITATLESSAQAFRILGRLLGRETQGEALAVFCEKTLSAEKNIMAQVGSNKIPALYCLGKTGLNVLPATSFHAEVLDVMTDNKAVVANPASRGSGNETDLEQLLLWNPEVILFEGGTVYSTVSTDATWRQMRAIGSGAYYEVPFGPYSWMGSPPSINRYLSILWLGKILYPQFATYDLYTEVAEYYRLFYGYDLSRAKFDALTINSVK